MVPASAAAPASAADSSTPREPPIERSHTVPPCTSFQKFHGQHGSRRRRIFFFTPRFWLSVQLEILQWSSSHRRAEREGRLRLFEETSCFPSAAVSGAGKMPSKISFSNSLVSFGVNSSGMNRIAKMRPLFNADRANSLLRTCDRPGTSLIPKTSANLGVSSWNIRS